MKLRILPIISVCCCLLAAEASAKIKIVPPPPVPPDLRTRDLRELTTARVPVSAEFDATQQKIDRQWERCRSVENGSADADSCKSEGAQVTAAVKTYRTHLKEFKERLAGAKEDKRVVVAMLALARRLSWGDKKIGRLSNALNELGEDGNNNATWGEVRDTWDAIKARGEDQNLKREASVDGGPGLPTAGSQSFEDCTIFALANATGEPYGVIAARANKLIAEGGWRTDKQRSDTEAVIKRTGLNAGEVVMMAEALGQAEVVPSGDFAKTIRAGRPVMVSTFVVTADGKQGDHEIVLTRTFQHKGEIWYEMIDSSPQGRFYLSHTELNTLLDQNGVAFRPEEKSVPQLLRSSAPTPSSPLPSP